MQSQGASLSRSNHDATILLVERIFGSVSTSSNFIDALHAAEAAPCRKNAVASAVPPSPSRTRILHGKEGVSGSSPEEGSAKAPHVDAFPLRAT